MDRDGNLSAARRRGCEGVIVATRSGPQRSRHPLCAGRHPATSSTFAIQYYADGMALHHGVASTPGFPLRVPKLGDFAYRPSPASPLQPGLFIATDSANGYFYLLDISSSGLASTLISAMPSSIYGPNPSQAGAILPNLYPTTARTACVRFAVVSQDRSSVGVVLMNPDGTWAPLPTKEYTGSGTVYSACSPIWTATA